MTDNTCYHFIIGGTSGIATEIRNLLELAREEFTYTTRQETCDVKAISVKNIDDFSTSRILENAANDICVYYFISSRILPDSLLTYNHKSNLENTQLSIPIKLLTEIKELVEHNDKINKVLFMYPSTIFIEKETRQDEYSFYVKLKKEAEIKLAEISASCDKLKIIMPRLNQSNTRQNMSIIRDTHSHDSFHTASLILQEVKIALHKKS